MTPYYDKDGITLYRDDCRSVMHEISDSSIDLIVTDPPYFKVKGDWWDRQWDKPHKFLAFIGELCDEWKRILKPNGSLYVFASPQMSHGVESEVRKRFNVLTNIRWRKPPFSTKAEMFVKDELRSPFPASEAIIFAEQYAANEAVTFADYELNGSVFAGLKQWFRDRARAAGIGNREFNQRLGFASNGGGVASGVIGDKIRFAMPTAEVYAKMRDAYPVFDREYEYLRREYEDLRRPFNASEKRPYTDVWDFATVQDYPGKHPCEKPLKMMEHIIETSSRPGALVLDCFAGSGVVGRACRNFGRCAILCEIETRWAKRIRNHIRQQNVLAFTDSET